MGRNFFYKVEKRTRNRTKVDCLLRAGNILEKKPARFSRGPSSIGKGSD
jgi:hypothetical protein